MAAKSSTAPVAIPQKFCLLMPYTSPPFMPAVASGVRSLTTPKTLPTLCDSLMAVMTPWVAVPSQVTTMLTLG